MALTKTQLTEKLSEAGIENERIPELVSWIMNGHITSINALREERDNYKADAEKLAEVQKELDDMKNGKDWKEGLCHCGLLVLALKCEDDVNNSKMPPRCQGREDD